MALLTKQVVNGIATPSFAAPTVSDTIQYEEGLALYVKIGGTATVVTLVIPGLQSVSGTAKTDLVTGSLSNAERVVEIPREAIDPDTGLVTVTFSNVTGVTVALLKV
jgi:hypothetical protein